MTAVAVPEVWLPGVGWRPRPLPRFSRQAWRKAKEDALVQAVTRQQVSTFSDGAAAARTTAFGTNPPAGSKVLVLIQCNQAITSVVDNGTSPSTFVQDAAQANGTAVNVHVYRADNVTMPSSGAYTVTCNQDGSATVFMQAVAYTGVVAGAAVATNGTAGVATTAVSSGAASGAAGAVYFGGFTDNTSLNPQTITFTSGAPFVEQGRETNGSANFAGAVADGIVAAGGSQTLTWTMGDAKNSACVIAVYNALSTGTGPVRRVGFAAVVGMSRR